MAPSLRADFSGAFAPTLSDTIIGEIARKSAFQQVSTEAQFDGKGLVIPNFGTGKASWVAEGEKKKASKTPVSTLTIVPHVLQRTVIFSNQLKADAPALAAFVVKEAVNSLASTFDQSVAGEVTAPVGFDSLGTAGVKTVTSYATFRAAMASTKGNPTTAIVMNTAMLDELLGVVSASDMPVFQISGNYIDGGTINGIPYKIYTSETATPLGFVGPFNRAFWGIVPGSFVITPLTEAAYDENGDPILLKSSNLSAVLVEARYGFRVIDKTEFSKLESGVVGG